MAEDPEIQAMAEVASALRGLDGDAVKRVVTWAAQRYGISLPSAGRSAPEHRLGAYGQRDRGVDADYEDFGELFHAAEPQTEQDRALVGAYWKQVVLGQDSFSSQEVNEELKNLGHGVSNITRAYDGLKALSPALVRQVAKAGKAKQGRKTYKITQAGIRAVEAMLAGAADVAAD